MAEIKELLDDAIETEIENLDSISDRDEKSKAIRDLAQLHKLRIEEIKTQIEADDKRERRNMDSKRNEGDLALREKQIQAQEEQQKSDLVLKEREAAGRDADRVHEDNAAIQQIRENRIDRCVKVGVAVGELVLPLMFYGLWMKRGFEFEKSGSFTSTTFKNLLNRFRPTK